MVYGQALKFLNKRVYAVSDEQKIIRGRLIKVGKDGYGIIVNYEPKTVLYRFHLRYIFPQK